VFLSNQILQFTCISRVVEVDVFANPYTLIWPKEANSCDLDKNAGKTKTEIKPKRN